VQMGIVPCGTVVTWLPVMWGKEEGKIGGRGGI
jgi:hypothetical protein